MPKLKQRILRILFTVGSEPLRKVMVCIMVHSTGTKKESEVQISSRHAKMEILLRMPHGKAVWPEEQHTCLQKCHAFRRDSVL